MRIQESLSERMADEWRQEERTIVKGGVVLFTVLLLTVFATILAFADEGKKGAALFAFTTFAVPCWAAVLGGLGLYHDHRGNNTAARKCFVASYLALLVVMIYFVLAHENIPRRAGANAALVVTVFAIVANALLIRKKKATPASWWLMVFHVIALTGMCTYQFIYS